MSERVYYSNESARRAKQLRLTIAGIAFALGAGVGAVITLLFASEPGEEVRKYIGQNLEEGFSTVENQVESGVRKVREKVS